MVDAEPEFVKRASEVVATGLLNAPLEVKKHLPRILSEDNVSLFAFSTSEHLIIALLSSEERKRVIDLKNRGLHPFPALIRPRSSDASVFFDLSNGTRYVYVGKMTLEGGFAFSLGYDCTLIIEDVKQIVNTKDFGRYEYVIGLAYIISFGDKINRENVHEFLKDLVAHSFEIWRSGDAKRHDSNTL